MAYGLLKRTVSRSNMSRGATEITTWELEESWGCHPETVKKQLTNIRNFSVLSALNTMEDMGWVLVCKEDADTYILRRT